MIELLLNKIIEKEAVDMYLTVGKPPCIRLKTNEITNISRKDITANDINKFIDELLNEKQKQVFENDLELNIPVSTGITKRFRVNLFKQRENNGVVIRRVITEVPSIEELELPEIYAEVLQERKGLIIIASPSGSGKSTSMAAMINHINENKTRHIVTVEEPIEFIHEHKKSIITQREVGSDTKSYSDALKNVLRQRADVIGIGEIRDRETMENSLRFAETGHLCIATLHSNNASYSINRIINFFGNENRIQTLSSLSQNLIGVFSQRIVAGVKKKNELASDILLNKGLIKSLLIDDRVTDIREAQMRLSEQGMKTFDQSLLELYEKKKITYKTAIEESDDPSTLKLRMSEKGLGMGDIQTQFQ